MTDQTLSPAYLATREKRIAIIRWCVIFSVALCGSILIHTFGASELMRVVAARLAVLALSVPLMVVLVTLGLMYRDHQAHKAGRFERRL